MRLGIHRELILPNPPGRLTDSRAELPTLLVASRDPAWLELHRTHDRRIRYYLGAPAGSSLMHTFNCLLETHAGTQLGKLVPCPATRLALKGAELWRAVQLGSTHYWPVQLARQEDYAAPLVRPLLSRDLDGHEVLLQVLFRRVLDWEFGFFSPDPAYFVEKAGRDFRKILERRIAQPAYHVEIRAAVLGPEPKRVWDVVQAWLYSWTSLQGKPWWSLRLVDGPKRDKFVRAFQDHDIWWFAGKRVRRDISGTELARVLPIPWKDRHVGISYVGAPSSVVPRELAASSATGTNLLVGRAGDQLVRLPREWNHLAVLGRTQTGKSSLALNLVLQLIEKRPDARVIVMEPTGELVRAIRGRLTPACASGAVEVDPAHPTFQEDGLTTVVVPFNPLTFPSGPTEDPIERERQREVVVGGILHAFRTAWGPESIGGRAEFVLRAILQGLLSTQRSNLVDAYYLLSDKQALHRFVRSLEVGPLRSFLETHLPRLDYPITISSLDKLGKIATNPLLRIALCQRAAPVPFDRILEHRLVLLNLSKGALGADGANFLGAIYLSQLWAALQRVGRPDRPIFLVVDEAQNYPVPVLAEMLSEGRKFGLHVVVVTQFLDRIAEGLRSALLGNVDSWAFFPLGVEDATTVWKIANGERFRWTPQDFVDGLGPRQFGLAVPGVLLKVDAVPVPPVGPNVAETERLVRESSQRYAQPEDSQASPWLVGQEEVESLLRGLARGPRAREDLLAETGLPPDRLAAALTRSEGAGDVMRGSSDRRYHLSARGNIHFRALQSRRNEGEEHVETLTEFCAFLQQRGIQANIPDQVGGILLPDAQFHWGGSTYSVEVECSTLSKAREQTIRNLRKGLAADGRVLVVLPSQEQLPSALAVVREAFPDLTLWRDGIGIAYRTGRNGFEPHRVPGIALWPFLGGFDDGRSASKETEGEPSAERIPVLEGIDPLLDRVEVVAHGLVAAGRTQATSRELLELLGDPRPTDEQLGTVLGALGAKGRRMRIGAARLRVYDLGGIRPNGGSTPEPIVADQRPGPAVEQERQDQKVLDARWSSGPPMEN